jgi:hypothetical protein
VGHADARAARELVGLHFLHRNARRRREGEKLRQRRALVPLAQPEPMERAPPGAQRLAHRVEAREFVRGILAL